MFIPVNEPLLDGNELTYVTECIETGWISSEGPFVKQFEEEFAKSVERKYAISVSNGSVALDLAIKALGIGEGDEVIMPTFTIISCAAAIVRAGATPVLVDSDPDTWNMNTELIENKINSRTKAIMVVHIYGLPVDMDPVLDIARKFDLRIIEDAAEMHGQTYRGQQCGSFGDISTFSFYPNKQITTGEGGMVVCNDELIADKCKYYRNLCFQSERRFVHEHLGWNFRLSNVQAAIGLAQLEKLDKTVDRKRLIGGLYNEAFRDLEGANLPVERNEFAENIYWIYGLVSTSDLDAKTIMSRLKQKNIGTRPFFWCMHEQPVFRKMGLFQNEVYPEAENMARKGFYIPSGLGLNLELIPKIAEAVKSAIY